MPIWTTKLLSKWPDLFVTFMGASIGVIGGWLCSSRIAKWQLNKQTELETKNDLELLKIKFDRVVIELRNNKYEVKKITKTLDKINHSRLDMWDWIDTIVETLSFKHYEGLIHSGLNKYLPKHIDQELYKSYDMLFGLLHMVKQSRMAHVFHYGYSANKKAADQLYENVTTYSKTVFRHLDYSTDIIYKYKDELMENKNN